jgi:cytochrome P450
LLSLGPEETVISDLHEIVRLPYRQRIDELYSYFAANRATRAAGPGSQPGVWEVFRYDEAVRVLSDPDTFSNDFAAYIPADQPGLAAAARGNLAGMDPPRHRRLRSLVNKAFTPRSVNELAPRLEKMAARLLDDAFAAADGSGQADLVRGFAGPLTAGTIAELFGVPESDHLDFWRWSDAMLGARPQGDLGIPDEEAMRKKAEVVKEAGEYLLAHIRHLRDHPGDDLTSGLTVAEVDGERLTDDEIFGLIGMFLLAGHLPTTTLIGSTVMCLAEHPHAASELAANPAALPDAIEEVLRWRPALVRDQRVTRQPGQLGGMEVPAGTMVVVWTASANRDPGQFPHPDVFDINREPPNRHLTLGKGIHFCIGSPLARLEARIALQTLLGRCPHPELGDGELIEFHPSVGVLGPVRLPVRLP